MDYIAVNKQLKTYFADLLIAEYRCSEKNRAFIEMLYDLVFVSGVCLEIKEKCLNVEESIGEQLDQIGEWIGVNRLYDNSLIWDRPYFSLIDWGKNPNILYQGGFSNYKNVMFLDGYTMTWKHLQDLRRVSYELGDNYFRQLIKLKIIKNSIRSVKKEIDEAIYEWSAGQIYTTWDKMKITYNYHVQDSVIMGLAYKKNCLPCPTSCELAINLI